MVTSLIRHRRPLFRIAHLLVLLHLLSVPVSASQHQTRPDSLPYSIGPSDELEITVLGYPELTTKTIVLPDGYISFPYIGRIRAAGHTVSSLSEFLQAALDPVVYDPQVTVTVLDIRSKRFSVLGEVRKPGVYTLGDMNMTVCEAIAQAEGFLPTAFKQQVSITRADSSGQAVSTSVDMSEGLLGSAAVFDLRLRPGDLIYVPGPADKRLVCVIGKVAMPGRYNFAAGMTVIDVLTAAGWITHEGVANSVMLVRRDSGKNVFMRVNAQQAVTRSDSDQDVQLEPGDIIYVPATFVSKLGNFAAFFTSSIEPIARTYLRVYDATNPASYVVER